jgi:hypothetical protein
VTKLNIELKPDRPDNSGRGFFHELRNLSWIEVSILATAALVSLYVLFELSVPSN